MSGVGYALGFLVCLAGLTACEDPSQAYLAAADLTRHGFVRNDPDRDSLLSAIVANARAGRATKVHVTGTLHTFGAPTNTMVQTGIYLDVDASSGVLLDRRQRSGGPADSPSPVVVP